MTQPLLLVLAQTPAEPSGFLRAAALITLAMVILSGVLATVRAARGPSIADRVVALDLLATLIVGAVIVIAILEAQPILLWVATALALLMFLGTVAYAFALLRGTFK